MDLHGGNIYKLKREGKGELLDYSSNINPLGVPEKFKKSVIENFDILEKYPDPDYIELRESIRKYNNRKIILLGYYNPYEYSDQPEFREERASWF